jgi:hypothetical protein
MPHLPHPHEPDHDRLVRIEAVLHHLIDKLDEHIDELRKHINDESEDFRGVREVLTKHLVESEQIRNDVGTLKLDVASLKNERMKMVGWIAGVVFVIGIVWTFADTIITNWLKR